MVGYGFQFAVFGFTDGANVSSMVPVIKVELHIILIESYLGLAVDRFLSKES